MKKKKRRLRKQRGARVRFQISLHLQEAGDHIAFWRSCPTNATLCQIFKRHANKEEPVL